MPADTKATNDLKMLARTVNLSIPTALDREHQQKLELLRNLSGNQFNNAFRNDEVQSTWDEIYLSEVYAKRGNNADLKNWASTNLPKLRDQLNKAEKLS
jgi:putative membrane protein